MWVTVIIIVFASLYLYLNNKIKYWQTRGVKYSKATIFIGNYGPLLSGTKNLGQLFTSMYQEFKNEAYVGFYKMSKPGLLISDPKIAKDILVKDFDSFSKNDVHVNEELDPLFAKNPFFNSGEKWKHTRSVLTPAFSSGKMKMMFPLMEIVAQNMAKYIESKMHDPLEAKEISAHFTTDNVATCAFGLEAKSFENTKSEFREMGRKIFNASFLMNLKISITFLEPALAKWLKIRLLPKECYDYFTSIVRQTLKHRLDNNIIRPDFLDMMQQLKVKLGLSFDDIDVTAHAIGFFVDGFETSATTMCFVLYCLAKYPDVQTKLRKHINDAMAKNDGFTYEAIQDMNYLEMVIWESMRLYPPGYMLLKLCTKEYAFPAPDGATSELMVQPGTGIAIPLFGYHMDEKYFPNPQKFDPERFSEANKQSIVKGSFMPFGDGPRSCLGQRFGLLQVKVAIVSLLRQFSMTVNKKTIELIEIDPKVFLTAAKGGLWLNFKKI